MPTCTRVYFFSSVSSSSFSCVGICQAAHAWISMGVHMLPCIRVPVTTGHNRLTGALRDAAANTPPKEGLDERVALVLQLV